MDVQINPGILNGTLEAISSKSELHRLLICAALAESPTNISVSGSAYDGKHTLPNDILATIACLQALGAGFEVTPGLISVSPANIQKQTDIPLLDCGESGSTFRFMLPVAAAFSGSAAFTGSGRLPERPITGLTDALKAHGVSFSSDRLPFSISGKPSGGIYEIPGNISSQYLTGLLLALPLLPENSEIRLTTALKSAGYIDITLQAMETFGVQVEKTETGYRLAEYSMYRSPEKAAAGGDWSNMAAFLTASMLRPENGINCGCLLPNSTQGDRKILDLLEAFGAIIYRSENGITTEYAPLHGAAIDIDETPDLLPVLAAAACAADGDTVFFNAGRLRLKESDRIESVADMIRGLGGSVETGPESLTVHGHGSLRGGTVDSVNDHRIVMAASIAASICEEPVIIRDAGAVNKSYPTFWDDFRSVKGDCYVL